MRKKFGKSRDSDRSGNLHSRFSRFSEGFGAPRHLHKAICADCGKECEVPFKPKEERPVYCRECFGKHRPKRF